ncbi:MAG: type III-B CRISPR module RAMP protein Cmr6 [Acidobacteria bacterium]|nr:type III-B CRISPR module RAMP protein Cmr6 [Acidobacteriota bacterium]
MRNVLQSVGTPDHLGLAYGAWAPVDAGGKVPDDRRAKWLHEVAAIPVSPDYSRAFESWKKSFSDSGDRVFELVLASRLLVGHGNSSATDVGITVHHTWGVPMVPGSAVKGLVAHFVDAVYGPDDPERNAWDQAGDERARADYQGVTWRGRRIARGPGAVYRTLFGAPDAGEDNALRERGLDAGAAAGLVAFHDALYVPDCVPDDKPFAADVLTVHQGEYYEAGLKWAKWQEHRHGSEPPVPWPSDYDSPNPVAFLTVRPGARLLFALSGPADWTELGERLLRRALENWGVGGKTSAGYGRLVAPERSVASAGAALTSPRGAVPKPGDRVEATLLEERTKKGGWKAKHQASGLTGPIQNSGDVPGSHGPGSHVVLVVASVNPREIAFKFPDSNPASTSEKKGKK